MGLPDLTSLIAFDDRLRMVPTDRAALALAVDALREAAGRDRSDSPGPAVLRRLGVGLIALGRAEQAIPVLGRAVALAVASADRRAEVAARINLGDGHRYAGDAMAAQEQYGLALELARSSVPELVDFALQHLGKALLEYGRYPGSERLPDRGAAAAAREGRPGTGRVDPGRAAPGAGGLGRLTRTAGGSFARPPRDRRCRARLRGGRYG
ncbi:MAG: hypothetical protein ACRDT2_03700 [Natronosporangium sp.]